MTLTIETPSSRAPERRYILQVLLGDFLGLEWRLQCTGRLDTRITLADSTGEIRLPDTLLSIGDDQWLTSQSMPELPLSVWDTRELAPAITLIEPQLPVIYGSNTDPGIQQDSTFTLPIDIFGSAFFMLTRYEEVVTAARDEHERFPARASVAYQENFLDRPIVDEYVEVLWAAIGQLWPQLERKKHHFKLFVTCDVDSAINFRGSWKRVIKSLGGDLIKRKSAALAFYNLVAALRANAGDLEADPHWHGLKWMMDTAEQADLPVAFYFIPEITDPGKDRPVSLDDPRMRKMLREMHHRGHEIGLHPGYNTFDHPEAMTRAVARLRAVMKEEGLNQAFLGGRQHFLRWQTPTTARLWQENGLSYDSTLGYADRPGFRCGTCREYTLFDVYTRTPLQVCERPLILMECSVIATRYLGMGYSDKALDYMLYYKRICQKFNGHFVLLWHNSHLTHQKDKSFLESLIRNGS